MAKFRYIPRAQPQRDIEPADEVFYRYMLRSWSLRDRYPGQARLALRELTKYLMNQTRLEFPPGSFDRRGKE